MKNILKIRWLTVAVWVFLSAVLTVLLPDLQGIINERGNVLVDSGYPSQVAEELMDNLSKGNGKTGVLVFTDANGLSSEDRESIQNALQNIRENQSSLGITNIVDAFDTPDAESQLVSEDQTTMIAQFTYEKNGRDADTVRSDLEGQIKEIPVTYYITGNEFISSDYVSQIMIGVEKSALLTIAFILIVLIIMFHSVVTPLVSLAAVGVSYLVSIGIVGQLVDKTDFPISTLTQMFIILILFGVGTDYNILLINRFKEELQKQATVDDAIAATYRTAGKTVVYSAATVFIAFLSLQFVKFSVYRSAVAVAIGIVVLIAVLFTLMPAMLKIFGKRLFWPSRNVQGHKQSALWGKVTSTAVKRPYLAMIAIAVVVLPVLIVNTYKLTFDNMSDMSNSQSAAVSGFNTISEHFGKGAAMPTAIVISSDKAMDNSADLTVIDSLTEKIRGLDGVSAVYGPTQPQGREIADFYTDSQVGRVSSGLASANYGIKEISGGLSTIYSKLSVPDLSQVEKLASGTSAIGEGMQGITGALEQIQKGMESGSSGSAQIKGGIETIKTNLDTVSKTLNNQLLPGYTSLKAATDQWAGGYSTIEQNLGQLILMAQALRQAVSSLDGAVSPSDPVAYGTFATLNGDESTQGSVAYLIASLTQLDNGLKAANESYANQISPNFESLNGGLSQVSAALPQMVSGLSSLEAAADALSQGLAQGSGGQSQVVASMRTMTDAVKEIAGGQAALSGGLSTVESSLTQLKDAIGQSSEGLNQITGGIEEANSYLSEFSGVKLFYIPGKALQNSDLQKAFDAFMSKDRKTAELTVILSNDPYSDEAVRTVGNIRDLLSTSINGTSLSDVQVAAGGETAVTSDLRGIATSDMATSQIIVLISIFIVLLFVVKSFWIPVYITGSILLTYYSTVKLTSLIAKTMLHTDELAWNVPFFAFLVIVTLGVDYSIFLMTRFREYRDGTPHEGIIRASSNVGSVVLSAALILSGTFATIIPTGINTLVELAVAICLGILMLSVIFLPFVIPSLISVQDWLNRRYGFNRSCATP